MCESCKNKLGFLTYTNYTHEMEIERERERINLSATTKVYFDAINQFH